MEASQFPPSITKTPIEIVVGYLRESGHPSALATANPRCTPNIAMIVTTARTTGNQALGSERRVETVTVPWQSATGTSYPRKRALLIAMKTVVKVLSTSSRRSPRKSFRLPSTLHKAPFQIDSASKTILLQMPQRQIMRKSLIVAVLIMKLSHHQWRTWPGRRTKLNPIIAY